MARSESPDRPSAIDFAIAEYNGLREESALARQAQQSILSWSIGAIAAVIAGAAALGASAVPHRLGIELAIFGFALPLIIVGGSLSWVGEMVRMERVGVYLRARERATWHLEERTNERAKTLEIEGYPLAWETFLGSGVGSTPAAKQRVGYVGGGVIYLGFFFASYAVFAALAVSDSGWNTRGVAATAVAVGVCGAYAAGLALLARRLVTMASRRAS